MACPLAVGGALISFLGGSHIYFFWGGRFIDLRKCLIKRKVFIVVLWILHICVVTIHFITCTNLVPKKIFWGGFCPPNLLDKKTIEISDFKINLLYHFNSQQKTKILSFVFHIFCLQIVISSWVIAFTKLIGGLTPPPPNLIN